MSYPGRVARGLRIGSAAEPEQLSRRQRVSGALRDAGQARRGADFWRWQGWNSNAWSARLLRAAPPPEGDRGDTGSRIGCGHYDGHAELGGIAGKSRQLRFGWNSRVSLRYGDARVLLS